MTAFEELVDYRRRVAAIYARVRDDTADAQTRWMAFRRARDELFNTHPQSPLAAEARAAFGGLDYYPYDPAMRFVVAVESIDAGAPIDVVLHDDGVIRLVRLGRVRFAVPDGDAALTVFWIATYGGGVFVPFRDATGATGTYPGGRYLLDSIKGADLGGDDGRLVLDFNYAYNPSCAYDQRWDCPLAPPENWLTVPVRAGEKRYRGTTPSR